MLSKLVRHVLFRIPKIEMPGLQRCYATIKNTVPFLQDLSSLDGKDMPLSPLLLLLLLLLPNNPNTRSMILGWADDLSVGVSEPSLDRLSTETGGGKCGLCDRVAPPSL